MRFLPLSTARLLLLGCLLVTIAPITSDPAGAEPFEARRMRTGNPRSVSVGFNLVPLGIQGKSSTKAAGVDVDSDGADEIAVVSTDGITVIRYGGYRETFIVWEGAAHGTPYAVASADIDGDSRTDLVVGWGGRKEPVKIVAYRTRGSEDNDLIAEEIVSATTARAEVASLSVSQLEANGPVGILYAYYVSRDQVRSGFAHLEGDRADGGKWKQRKLYEESGATYVASGRYGNADHEFGLFVARAEGEETRSPGRVEQYASDGKRVELPSTRGVRSLAVVTAGGRGSLRHRVCYGDGWHPKLRSSLLTCAKLEVGGKFSTELLQKTQGSEISAIAAGDLDGDGVNELIARGSMALYRFLPVVAIDGLATWDPRIIGPGGRDFGLLDVNGDGTQEIVLGGSEPSLLLRR